MQNKSGTYAEKFTGYSAQSGKYGEVLRARDQRARAWRASALPSGGRRGAAGRPGKARRYACLLKINVLDGGWALRDGRDVPATPIKGLASENNASPVHSQKILDGSLHTESWGTFALGVSIRRIHNK